MIKTSNIRIGHAVKAKEVLASLVRKRVLKLARKPVAKNKRPPGERKP